MTIKTDWTTSDYFTYSDWNRLKANIEELVNDSSYFWDKPVITALNSKTVESYLYADEVNNLIDDITVINTATVNVDLSSMKTYVANGPTFTAAEMNIIENNIKLLAREIVSRYNLLFHLPKTMGLEDFD